MSVRGSAGLRVDRTKTARVERAFQAKADAGYATSAIDHTWTYLHQSCLYALRRGVIKTDPAADVLLPAARPARTRKSLSIEEADKLLHVGIPQDARPALWMTGLMCGLRPRELAGLGWPYSTSTATSRTSTSRNVSTRSNTATSDKRRRNGTQKGRSGLHPLVVEALRRHRNETITDASQRGVSPTWARPLLACSGGHPHPSYRSSELQTAAQVRHHASSAAGASFEVP